jgi:hypothetical protein
MRKTKNFALVLGAVLVLVAGSMASAATVFQSKHAADGTLNVPSNGETLYSQLDDPTGSAFTDQAFEASYAAYDGTGADDFQVTAASGWDISVINTPGAFVPALGQVPFFINNAFYADGGGAPGAVLAGCDNPGNTDFTTDGTGDLSINVSCNAPMGTAWVSQNVRIDFNPFGQHFWATRNTAVGNAGVWQNPGDGFGSGCVTWSNAATCGQTGADMLFELLGKVRPDTTTTTTSGVPAVGPLGIGLMLLALGGGSAYVLGRRRQA